MNKLISILIIVGIIILGLIMIGVGLSLYKDVIQEPENKAPVIVLNQTNINATIGQPLVLNATVTDDSKVAAVLWSQEAGPEAEFEQIGDDLYFTPQTNGTYIFKLEAQDDKTLITTIGVQIVAKVAEPQQEDCEPDERKIDGKCVEIPRPTCDLTKQYYNATDNTCRPKPTVPAPQPTPQPQPTPTTGRNITVAVLGDVDGSTGGTAVYNQIVKLNPTYVVVLGDLGYDENLNWFKETYGSLGFKVFCITGNHEDEEEDGDGNTIEDETLKYCGNSYWIRDGPNMFFFLNTNGNLAEQQTNIIKLLSNTTEMKNVKNLHIFSHKPCAAPPNSHHPVESKIKTFCDNIKVKIPTNIKVFYTQAHNHVMSESADKQYKQSGAGGRNHYTCPESGSWNGWCNNTSYGFVLYKIGADGTTTHSWIDSKGVKIR